MERAAEVRAVLSLDCGNGALGSQGTMKKEYDFTKGKRGLFYKPGAELNIPVYLEPDVAKAVRRRASKKDLTISMSGCARKSNRNVRAPK